MKTNYRKFLLGLSILITFTACNDNYLDEKPRSFLSPEVTYDTDAGLASGAVGLYDEIGYLFYGGSNWESIWSITNGATDFNQMGLQKTEQPLNLLNTEYGPATTENSLIKLWSHYYREANNATTIIEFSKKHDWQNDELRKQTEGEAHFFRGYAHFYLTMLWGDVPMIKEIVNGIKLDFTNSPKSENLEFVIEDFKKAAELLPAKSSQAGRITKATGNHMLAYAYLAAKDYPNSETAAKAAINDPNHSLVTQRFGSKVNRPEGNVFWDLFQLNNHNNNPEGLMVFQNGNAELYRQYLPASGGDHFRGPRMLIPRYESANGLVATTQYGGRGYGRFSPTMGYYGLFEPGDIRGKYPCLQTVWVANENRGNIKIGDTLFVFGRPEKSIYKQDDIRLRPFPTKWNKEYDPNDPTMKTPHPDEEAYTGSTIRDHYLIRLAETYLILAEAQHMQSKNNEAAESINTVRRRSNAREISASEVTVDFILDEKARELWGEGFSRKVELFRTGKYIERVKKYNTEAAPNVAEKHTLIPIPQAEIDLNSEAALQQNPGWK
jgi:hypothetical protein